MWLFLGYKEGVWNSLVSSCIVRHSWHQQGFPRSVQLAAPSNHLYSGGRAEEPKWKSRLQTGFSSGQVRQLSGWKIRNIYIICSICRPIHHGLAPSHQGSLASPSCSVALQRPPGRCLGSPTRHQLLGEVKVTWKRWFNLKYDLVGFY